MEKCHQSLIDSWLRPSAIEAAWALASEGRAAPMASAQDHIRLLSSTYSTSGYDFAVGLEILREFGSSASSKEALFRDVFFEVMSRTRPPLLMLVAKGRKHFAEALTGELEQCLSLCGALSENPSSEVVAWLDRLAALWRSTTDQLKLEMGREAERRSFEREQATISVHAPHLSPTWIALNDNSAGYDIHSFAVMGTDVSHRLIEVKACNARRPEFHLTRHEVRTATQNPVQYVVQIWHLEEGRVLELPWREVAPFVPADTERGRWEDIVVRWPSW